ncbi:MAG: hypothetical protein V7K27_26715 [Nostoc sp.]
MRITAKDLLQRYAAGEINFGKINLVAFFVRPPWLMWEFSYGKNNG